MGKSYKKFYIVRQEKEDYRILNRKIRHDKLAEIPKGAAYRRMASKCGDWSYPWSREQATRQFNNCFWIQERYQTLDAWLQYWAKCVKRK